MRPKQVVASLDSATRMLQALSSYLAARDAPAIDQAAR
ncbi:hypothetical protein FHX42_001464 [Saccharopolyspora lacisalsi]|uniref:Uncharacterized protein n=1 Tax=Halosaccharopolyspora lacisalsi TaxID=1000566 RepID=A0A839DXP7_9PSEU|nr:hypothetical protein [Halosaccharopolyspora lacisalsi]